MKLIFHPSGTLPVGVIDEEVDRILDFGVVRKFNEEVKSLKSIIEQDYDAIFIGTGAPKGKDLDIPGRKEASNDIYVGIDWLTSVAFKHVDKIGKKVIVIGGGNVLQWIAVGHHSDLEEKMSK